MGRPPIRRLLRLSSVLPRQLVFDFGIWGGKKGNPYPACASRVKCVTESIPNWIILAHVYEIIRYSSTGT